MVNMFYKLTIKFFVNVFKRHKNNQKEVQNKGKRSAGQSETSLRFKYQMHTSLPFKRQIRKSLRFKYRLRIKYAE